tara:strand:- start:25 stop:282 length:258 start_codon:yes stop_codon:yes gene_type:complete
MAKIYIDNSNYINFISDIAHKMVEQSFNIEDIGDEEGYKKDAQIFFDEKYDEVETMLNKTLNVHSNLKFYTNRTNDHNEHFDGDN